jgi:hypothetical protein
VEQKYKQTHGIPIWPIPRQTKQLGTLFHGTKIANTWNSVPNHSAEEKTSRNSMLWNKNKSKLSEFRSKAFLFVTLAHFSPNGINIMLNVTLTS